MDNGNQERLADWQDLALSHAGEKLRAPLRDALLLDRRLSRIVLTATEPALGQLKLAWWREELAKVASGNQNNPPDPLLAALAQTWGEDGEQLNLLIDGWEAQLPSDEDPSGAPGALAKGRGEVFSKLATLAGQGKSAAPAATHGAAWAYAELAQLSGGQGPQALEQGLETTSSLPSLPRDLRALAVIGGLSRRALLRGGKPLFGDRFSPFAALRLGIIGS
ncbi:squalene/phytoene synthase family protein [Qipengyuania gelatinilytica]|uniref:Squalene/phytoene synthase family protein n=1 Tax=Qipengyuania gelatinilytica TaxID=2867231 RepID=A0ABX9A5A4_9SPHN|nr:squalene/phytoene synthase family protein [Qipengyuania gelatinilytica]QZD95399.1 squalene/phytoene synthase family protein [Qipengyuania gelatinilytica]